MRFISLEQYFPYLHLCAFDVRSGSIAKDNKVFDSYTIDWDTNIQVQNEKVNTV